MIGIGTIVNTVAVIAGGLIGLCLKGALKKRFQDIVMQALGLAVIFIGASGAMSYFTEISGADYETANTILMVLSLAIGAVIGEFMNINKRTEDFGTWLKKKFSSENDSKFVDGFISASLTICVGAMAIVGPLEDALLGNPSILYTKSILDFVILIVLSCSMGKGAIFSVIPLVAIQGGFTLLAGLIDPLLNDFAVANISFIGSMLIFCIGINLMFDKKIKIANMLPSLLIVAIGSYLI
ncbi:MAG: DUF554 domain-containing protein [Clostridia bacterium]